MLLSDVATGLKPDMTGWSEKKLSEFRVVSKRIEKIMAYEQTRTILSYYLSHNLNTTKNKAHATHASTSELIVDRGLVNSFIFANDPENANNQRELITAEVISLTEELAF